MKKIVAVALLCAVFTTPVFADDSSTSLGLRLGGNAAGFDALSKSSDTSFGLLDGYRHNRNFAVGGKFTDLGQFSTAAAVTDNSDTWGLSAIGLLPLNNNFSLYGKLGAARTNASVSAVTGVRRTTTIYGLGGQYNTTPRIGIRFGWDRYGMGVASQNADDDLYSLTAVFKF
ncbi:MAG TPA: outer membrane beta-barrel protein [Gallionella sp.]|nr:outer membrane beta-barrel protein [Gallionella sp.]